MVSQLTVKIGADIQGLQQELAKAQTKLSGFEKSMSGIRNSIMGAFGAVSVGMVASFALEVSKLAGEAEAVKAAFDRLPNSVELMDNLKRATGGTVSQLELMKRAVQANNFEISLQALPRLLEFATLRAQQTGQSVDYLVDSIVTGIGRKSKLILDNLGISAVQLNEALGGATTAASSIGDVADAVGRIAEANLKNMAAFSENASTKLQRLTAEWENLKVAIGKAANGTGVLGRGMDGLTSAVRGLASEANPFLKFFSVLAGGGVAGGMFADMVSQYEKLQAIADRAKAKRQQAGADIDPITGLPLSGATPWEAQIQTLDSLNAKVKELEESKNSLNITDRERLLNLQQEINQTKKLIDTIEASLIQVNNRAKPSHELKGTKTGANFLADSNASNPVIGMMAAGFDGLSGINGELSVGIDKLKEWGESARIQSEIFANSFVDISSMISSAMANLADSLGQALVGTQNFGDAVIKELASFAQQFGALLIATGLGKIAFSKFSGPAMIAAGATLVALGGAVKAAMASRPSLGEGGGSGGRSAPGVLPSQARERGTSSIEIVGKISGDSLAITRTRNDYKKGRTG